MKRRATAWALLSLSLAPLTAIACQRPAARNGNGRVTAAKRIARAFIAADTIGHWQAADSLVNWAGCDFDPATDYLQLVVHAGVTGVATRGDTVDVTIEYDVLGRAWSYDRKEAGERNWRFAPERHVDRVVLLVLPASRSRPPIACGEYQANHVALSQMNREISHMDDSSRVALAQAQKQR